MERGVVFYMDGSRIAFSVPVFLRSLKDAYGGPVGCVLGPTVPDELAVLLEGNGVVVVRENAQKFPGWTKAAVWSRKAWHHRGEYPFDVNLYFDLDIVFNSFDMGIFDLIENHELVVCTPGEHLRKEEYWVEYLNGILGTHLTQVIGCAGGLCGAVKNSPRVIELCNRIEKLNRVKFWNPDEYALDSMYSEGKAGAVDYTWNRPAKHHRNKTPCHSYHCQRSTYMRCKRWREEFCRCYSEDYMNLRTNPKLYPLMAGMPELAKSVVESA